MSIQPFNAVVAFIQPFQLERVIDALRLIPNFPGVSLSEVRGFGRHGAHAPKQGERAEVDPFGKYLRLEIVCRGSDLTSIIETIRTSAHTGHPGDGKVFVSDLAWAVRIRSGEIGDAAILGGPEGARGDESTSSSPTDDRT